MALGRRAGDQRTCVLAQLQVFSTSLMRQVSPSEVRHPLQPPPAALWQGAAAAQNGARLPSVAFWYGSQMGA